MAAALAVACGAATPDEATAGSEPSEGAAAGAVGDASAYPTAYRNLDLPILPGGVVTSTGRQTTSLRDGLSIRVSSDKQVAELRQFYREAMTSLDWTPAASGPGAAALNLPVANVIFTRGQLSFSATITALDSVAQVSITVLER